MPNPKVDVLSMIIIISQLHKFCFTIPISPWLSPLVGCTSLDVFLLLHPCRLRPAPFPWWDINLHGKTLLPTIVATCVGHYLTISNYFLFLFFLYLISYLKSLVNLIFPKDFQASIIMSFGPNLHFCQCFVHFCCPNFVIKVCPATLSITIY